MGNSRYGSVFILRTANIILFLHWKNFFFKVLVNGIYYIGKGFFSTTLLLKRKAQKYASTFFTNKNLLKISSQNAFPFSKKNVSLPRYFKALPTHVAELVDAQG